MNDIPARPLAAPIRTLTRINTLLSRIPDSLIALLGRFSIAAVFWLSGQTKVEGLAINLVQGQFQLGWPKLADSAVFLFQTEYALPLIPPVWAATAAALAEHVLPVLILVGLAARLSALGLLAMTLVIQVFVYPDAYPTHGVWATVLLYLAVKGAGVVSLDHWLAQRAGAAARTPSVA